MKKAVREKFAEYVEDANRYHPFENIARKGLKLFACEKGARISYVVAQDIFAAGWKA